MIAIIDEAAVRRALSMADCIALIDITMRRVSQGGAVLPLRTVMPIPDSADRLGVMPGYLGDPAALGVKIVGLYPGNPARGRSSHMGLVVLLDVETGTPLALLDAGAITALRTAAASAVATRILARSDACDLAILGAGEQAAHHLQAMAQIRSLRRIRIWSRSLRRAEELKANQDERALPCPIEICGDVRSAVEGADLICTTTASAKPILQAEYVSPGAHVNLVGASVRSAAEAAAGLVARGRYFVDYRPSALAQAGELHDAVEAGLVGYDHISGEIGEVLLGLRPGRTSDGQITIYKSLGIAAQDIAAARWIYDSLNNTQLNNRQPVTFDNLSPLLSTT